MGIVKIIDTKFQKAKEAKVVKELKSILFYDAISYENGRLNKEDLKGFCKFMVEYCRLTRHKEAFLPSPNIKFEDLDKLVDGNYTGGENAIRINNLLLDDILNGERHLSELINTIGHEMTHYHQKSNVLEYEKSSPEEQKKFDEEVKESIFAYKNYLNLGEDDVEALHALLRPYEDRNVPPKGYESMEDFYGDISYASYYTLQSEKEAREGGVDFAMNFYQDLSKSKKFDYQDSKNDKGDLGETQERQERIYSGYKSWIKSFENMDESQIINLVERVESKNPILKNFNALNYKIIMQYLIRNKTLEQKEALFKNATYNGYPMFAEVLVKGIEKDKDYQENKDEISTFVCDCLTGEAYGEEKYKFPNAVVTNVSDVKYTNLLNQDSVQKLTANLIENGSVFTAGEVVATNGKAEFPLDFVLACQDQLQEQLSKEENSWDNVCAKNFFNKLFANIDTKERIEWETCEQLLPAVYNILSDGVTKELFGEVDGEKEF